MLFCHKEALDYAWISSSQIQTYSEIGSCNCRHSNAQNWKSVSLRLHLLPLVWFLSRVITVYEAISWSLLINPLPLLVISSDHCIARNNLVIFQMFVRLFVDENLDRHVPISKQPKEKIQAIIDSCTRQFPEYTERPRKRIRTYLKSCRRTKRSREQAGLDTNNVRRNELKEKGLIFFYFSDLPHRILRVYLLSSYLQEHARMKQRMRSVWEWGWNRSHSQCPHH